MGRLAIQNNKKTGTVRDSPISNLFRVTSYRELHHKNSQTQRQISLKQLPNFENSIILLKSTLFLILRTYCRNFDFYVVLQDRSQ